MLPHTRPLPPPPSAEHRDCDLELRFEEVIVGDTRMLRTPLPFGCETQPFFLGLSQHAGLLASVRPSLRAGGGPRLLVLTGPVKCSKSSVLHSILPALIVQEYNRSGLPGGGRPFIVPFTFSCFSSPEVAAQQLEIGLRDALAGLGVRIQSHYVAEQALLQLPNTLAHAAQAVHEAGRSLWLLVDECPVSILHPQLSCLFYTLAAHMQTPPIGTRHVVRPFSPGLPSAAAGALRPSCVRQSRANRELCSRPQAVHFRVRRAFCNHRDRWLRHGCAAQSGEHAAAHQLAAKEQYQNCVTGRHAHACCGCGHGNAAGCGYPAAAMDGSREEHDSQGSRAATGAYRA